MLGVVATIAVVIIIIIKMNERTNEMLCGIIIIRRS
jgi:hypothetical protein